MEVKVAHMELNMVANMEVDMVADTEVDMVADVKVDMVADMEVVCGLRLYFLILTWKYRTLSHTATNCVICVSVLDSM